MKLMFAQPNHEFTAVSLSPSVRVSMDRQTVRQVSQNRLNVYADRRAVEEKMKEKKDARWLHHAEMWVSRILCSNHNLESDLVDIYQRYCVYCLLVHYYYTYLTSHTTRYTAGEVSTDPVES